MLTGYPVDSGYFGRHYGGRRLTHSPDRGLPERLG